MKVLKPIFVAVILFPLALYAQDTGYLQKIIVFQTGPVQFSTDLETDCAWAVEFLPFELQAGLRSDIHALSINSSTGHMDVENGEKIGEFQSCWDIGEPATDAIGENYEQSVANIITIDGVQYGTLGLVRPRTFGNFPHGDLEQIPPAQLFGEIATVVAIRDQMPAEVVGSLTISTITNRPGEPDYAHNRIMILRLFTPYNRGWEAFGGAR